MKIKTNKLVMAFLLYGSISLAQVGINTTSPEKLLHIDASGLSSEGITISNTGFSAQLLTDSSTGNFILNNTLATGLFDLRFDNVSRYSFSSSVLLPGSNATNNTVADGIDIGRFDRHFRRVYSQAIHTNDNDPEGGLRINIGSSGGTVSDYNFSDFALYPVQSQVKDLGRNGNFWNNFFFVSAFTPSDERLKENIKEVGYGLSSVQKLNVYEYNYTFGDRSKKHFGFKAQELLEVMPELVYISENEEKSLSVNYMELIPILVKAIQEQQIQIDKQSQMIAALKK